MMMVHIDSDLNQRIVMRVMVNHDHVKMVLIATKDSMKMIAKVNHWKALVVHLITMDIFHDDLMIDQIEMMMMMNDYHNNLIVHYFHYLFDSMMKEYVLEVDNQQYDDHDNVLMHYCGMKQELIKKKNFEKKSI
jgi:hypothetical protein